jgi:hypothetical protein
MSGRGRFWQWIAQTADDLTTDRMEPAVENTKSPSRHAADRRDF